MPRFAANLSMLYNEVPFLERFAAAAADGFKAVEYLFPYEYPPHEIAARLQAHGLVQALFNLPPGDWADENFTTTSDGESFYYTGATAITQSWAESHGCDVTNAAVVFDAGTSEAECRTFCSSDTGWPRVLDCRADMGHTYQFSWTWPLILEFFTAHSL